MGKPDKQPRNSIIVEPKPADEAPTSQDAGQDAAYLAQKARDEAAILIENQKREQHDQIGTLLGSNFFIENKGFSWLRMFNAPMTVSRFYPMLNTAVDIFKGIGPNEETEIAVKRKLFKAQGLRYGALSYAMDLSELIAQVGIPELVA